MGLARNVIITGGFGTLGRVVVSAFVNNGDRVAVIDFAPEPEHALDGVLNIASVDLADQAAVQQSVERVVAQFGGVDVLVNIAGGFVWETLSDGSLETWTRMSTTNLVTNATVTKLALPFIRESTGGRIINIGAGAAIKAGAGMGAYAASKSGVHRLTEALAEELAGTSVCVNAVLPSIIDTPANRADMPGEDFSQWVKPEAIADVILFIASHEARSISGALIPVTRGA